MLESELVECPKCGWCHFAISEEYVQQWEAEWQILFETKDKEWLSLYGITDTPPTREGYLQCFRCGNKNIKDFFVTEKTLNGHTIQPILWEPE